MTKLEDIDRNFAAPQISDEGMTLHEIRQPPFQLHGLCRPEEGGPFRRLPKEVAEATSDGVKWLAGNTAGGRLRFSTNSRRIRIVYRLPMVERMNHMPLSGSSSFDLYADGEYQGFFAGSQREDGFYEAIRYLPGEARMQQVMISFPLYNPVDELYIALDDGATVEAPRAYTYTPPIAFYGSSITQGGCASHAGNDYISMISRMLDADILNFGFSGSCRGEQTIAEYLGALDLSVFVMDYDHNSPTNELRERHQPFFRTFRKHHPTVPVLIVSAADPCFGDECPERKRILLKTYHDALAEGDRNVYFLDGDNIYAEVGFDYCTVDRIHPNDLGFYQMAKHIGAALRNILKVRKR